MQNQKREQRSVTDRRFLQANREALIAVGLSLAYFIWWYGGAYLFGDKPISEYTYIMGLPTWFFLSCVAGFFLFAGLAALMVTCFFKEVPLDAVEPSNDGGDA